LLHAAARAAATLGQSIDLLFGHHRTLPPNQSLAQTQKGRGAPGLCAAHVSVQRIIAKMRRIAALLAIAFATACAHAPQQTDFALRSATMTEGGRMADDTMLNGLDCHGSNVSPALRWEHAPAGTQSFVLVLDDYEARGGDGFIHWAVYNIPATV